MERVEITTPPQAVEEAIQITTNVPCSVNCSYCPQDALTNAYFNGNPSRESVLTLESFKAYIDTVPKKLKVMFSGFGEPMQNKEIAAMFRYATERGHLTFLSTSLHGATLDTINEIYNTRLGSMHIHIDEKHLKNLHQDKEYIKIISTLYLYTQTNPDFMVIFTCMSDLPEQFHYLIGKRNIFVNQGPYHMANRCGNLTGPNFEINFSHDDIKCCKTFDGYNLNRTVMLPDGTLVLCEMDYGMKHVLGSLKTQSYDEILQSEASQRIRKAMSDEEIPLICRECNLAVPKELPPLLDHPEETY